MSNKLLPANQITINHTPDGPVNIEVMYANENIRLSRKRIAELIDRTPDNISLHLRNIYMEKELEEKATAEDFPVVQTGGSREARAAV